MSTFQQCDRAAAAHRLTEHVTTRHVRIRDRVLCVRERSGAFRPSKCKWQIEQPVGNCARRALYDIISVVTLFASLEHACTVLQIQRRRCGPVLPFKSRVATATFQRRFIVAALLGTQKAQTARNPVRTAFAVRSARPARCGDADGVCAWPWPWLWLMTLSNAMHPRNRGGHLALDRLDPDWLLAR